MGRIHSILLALLLTAGNAAAAHAVDEPAYTLVKEDGPIEIRDYNATVAADVVVQGERREAINDGFRILFKYIDGANTDSQKIPMTAPVGQRAMAPEAAGESQKIPMTAPVAQQADGQGNWTVTFFLPNDMTFAQAPAPTDKRVTIREVPPRRMAVIRFSGRFSDANLKESDARLRDYLAKHDLDFTGPPIYAGYDPPWTLWFLRRNEVLYKLKD